MGSQPPLDGGGAYSRPALPEEGGPVTEAAGTDVQKKGNISGVTLASEDDKVQQHRN